MLKHCFMIVMYNQRKTWLPNQSGALSANRGATLTELSYSQIIPLIKVMHPFCWFTRATLAKNSCLISHLKAQLTSSTVNKPLQWLMRLLLLCINSAFFRLAKWAQVLREGSFVGCRGLSHFQSLCLFYGTDLLLSPLLCVLLVSPGCVYLLLRDILRLAAHLRCRATCFPVSLVSIYNT